MKLNEKAAKILVFFVNNNEAEFEGATVDYASRVVRVTHPGRQIIIPFEAIRMVVMEDHE